MKSISFNPPSRLVFKWRLDHIACRGRSWRPRHFMSYAMPLLSEYRDSRELEDRLRDAPAVTAELVSDVISEACRRFPPIQRTGKAALIELELPQWQIRRIVYDEGEWHCALSRQRELPEWIDQSIEARHADLPLAILMTFVDAQRASTPSIRTSVPTAPREANPLYESVCCDNFT
jgi:hypothetical protein